MELQATGLVWRMQILGSRRPALDGLRGIAAVVVVIHHSLLIAPSLANADIPGTRPATWSWPWILTYTPLHLFWAGGEAVLIFFVLSGLVLAMPSVNGRQARWRSYYPQRLLRLYLPIIVATGFALMLVRLVPRHPSATSSWWLAVHISPVSIREAVQDAAVLWGGTGLNTALWSLKWEVIFSLLLPIYLLLFVRIHRWTSAKAALLVGLVAASSYLGNAAMLYLPIFGLGVVMAQNLNALDGVGARFDGRRALLKVTLALVAVAALLAHWWMPLVPGISENRKWNVAQNEITIVGACLMVWMFASTTLGRRAGTQRTIQWLGKRSFSLYLVHEPIVVTLAYLLGANTNSALVLLITVPATLAAAEIFGTICEVPTHRFAKAVGRRIDQRSAIIPLILRRNP